MPNHVRQRLTVAGAKEDVSAFVITARGARPSTGDRPGEINGQKGLVIEPLCFHMIAPLDDKFSMHPYGSGGSVGYQLEVDGWSVKWGPYDYPKKPIKLSPDGTMATYNFTCAWGPPVKALQRASLRYPTLSFFLSWGGEGPCRGRHSFKAGKVVSKREDDYATQIKLDCATDEEYQKDEDAACAKSRRAERKYIRRHRSWVAKRVFG